MTGSPELKAVSETGIVAPMVRCAPADTGAVRAGGLNARSRRHWARSRQRNWLTVQRGRITTVPLGPRAALVHTALGLGRWRDDTRILFRQVAAARYNLIDHAANGQPITHYPSVVGSRGYDYGSRFRADDAEAREERWSAGDPSDAGNEEQAST